MASERVRAHGLSAALEGELILPKKSGRAAMRHGMGPGARRSAVHMVTAAEAAAKTYSVRRVVLPLPGRDIRMPRTAVGAFYSSYVSMDGIDPYAPSLERSSTLQPVDEAQGAEAEVTDEEEEVEAQAEAEAEATEEETTAEEEATVEEEQLTEGEAWNWLTLQGDYRPLILRPRNMTWKVCELSDDSPLEGRAHAKGQASAAAAASLLPQGEGADGCEGGQRGVLVQFDLPPGAYATMALREVQKPTRPPSRQAHIRFC